jgi:hypothetical protein
VRPESRRRTSLRHRRIPSNSSGSGTFKEFTPIKDYSGKKFDLEFLKIELGEPKVDEHYAKAQKLTLDIPVRAT